MKLTLSAGFLWEMAISSDLCRKVLHSRSKSKFFADMIKKPGRQGSLSPTGGAALFCPEITL